MGLDYGRRRIGVAVSDPTGVIASPHSVVANSGEVEEPPDRLLELLSDLDPVGIVLGIPFEMDGTAGEMAREVRAFGRALGERTGLPVREWDERLSSDAARRALIESGAPERARRRKETTDMMAATLLLRAFLSSPGAGFDPDSRPEPDAEAPGRDPEGSA